MYIKTATVEDAKAMSIINARSCKWTYVGILPQGFLDDLKEDYWVELFTKRMEEKLLQAKIIYDDANAVGCISFGKAREDTHKDWGEIMTIYLLPEYSSKGYGKALVDCAVKELKNQGYQNIYLWVFRENDIAKNFYKKCGFKPTEDELVVEILGEKLTQIRYVYTTL